MKFYALATLAAAVFAMGATAAFAQGDLIVNGSFELPVSNGANQIIPGGDSTSIAGWTTVLSGVERFDPSLSLGIGAAPDGNIVIDLCPFTFSGGGLEQVVPTVAGQSYTLSFLAGTSNAFGRTGDAVLGVVVGGNTTTFNLLNLQSVIVYNPYSINFVASAATTTVRFQNLQDANTHFAIIDRVSIPVAVPEANALYLAAFALPLLGTVRSRKHR